MIAPKNHPKIRHFSESKCRESKAAENFHPLLIVYRDLRAGIKPARKSIPLTQDGNLDAAVHALFHAVLGFNGKIALTGDDHADSTFDASFTKRTDHGVRTLVGLRLIVRIAARSIGVTDNKNRFRGFFDRRCRATDHNH